MEEVKALETRLVLKRWMTVAYHPPPPPPPRSFICSFDWLLISCLDWPVDIWSLSYGKDLSQLRIQGRDQGPRSPLVFRPNWGPKGRKKFFETVLPPASQGLDDRNPPPPPAPHPLSEGLDLPLLTVALGSSHSRKYRLTCYLTTYISYN